MPDYRRGKIYRVVCGITGQAYYGSTSERYLSVRLAKHVSKYREFEKSGTITTSEIRVFPILERGAYRIELLENYPCDTRAELEAREGEYIQTRLNAVNHNLPGLSDVDKVARASKCLREKRACSCGADVSRRNYAVHLRSAKHQKALSN